MALEDEHISHILHGAAQRLSAEDGTTLDESAVGSIKGWASANRALLTQKHDSGWTPTTFQDKLVKMAQNIRNQSGDESLTSAHFDQPLSRAKQAMASNAACDDCG